MKESKSLLLFALLGAAALALFLDARTIAAPPVVPQKSGLNEGSVFVEFAPRAKHLVRILAGETYLVPDGHFLTIKSLIAPPGTSEALLKINGQTVLVSIPGSPLHLEVGIAGVASDSVTVEEPFPGISGPTVALGYLSTR